MDKAEKVMNLAMRRGFFWLAYEIYGGVAGTIVWGPHGVAIKNKVVDLWRKMFIQKHGFFEIQGPAIAPRIVFEASGHVEGFKDVMVTCMDCGKKYRADTLLAERGMEVSESLSLSEFDRLFSERGIRCPSCGGKLGKSTYFITMFRTTIGPYTEAEGFLRPETAQNMFVEFRRVYESFRRVFPIGIAQIGRGYRNEISPRQGPIRLREFDMMELEYFFDPLSDDCPYYEEVKDEELNILHEVLIRGGGKEYETMTLEEAVGRGIIRNRCLGYFMVLAVKFLEMLGVPRKYQRFKEKLEGERAHYAVQTFDQEVKLDRWGWVEVSGHANRTNYDLSRHIEFSGRELYAYRKLDRPKKIVVKEAFPKPRVIKKHFGDKIADIMKSLNSYSPRDIYESLERDGYIQVGEVKLTMEFFDIRREEKTVEIEPFIPHVVEPSFGLDRVVYAVLEYAYREVNDRVVLSLPPFIAPVEAAVFPLVSDERLVMTARDLYSSLRDGGYTVFYDEADSIGRRYARADEIGVPVAITVDFRSLEDGTVTVRDRDTWIQYRINKEGIKSFIDKILSGEPFTDVAESMGLEPYTQ